MLCDRELQRTAGCTHRQTHTHTHTRGECAALASVGRDSRRHRLSGPEAPPRRLLSASGPQQEVDPLPLAGVKPIRQIQLVGRRRSGIAEGHVHIVPHRPRLFNWPVTFSQNTHTNTHTLYSTAGGGIHPPSGLIKINVCNMQHKGSVTRGSSPRESESKES